MSVVEAVYSGDGEAYPAEVVLVLEPTDARRGLQYKVMFLGIRNHCPQPIPDSNPGTNPNSSHKHKLTRALPNPNPSRNPNLEVSESDHHDK